MSNLKFTLLLVFTILNTLFVILIFCHPTAPSDESYDTDSSLGENSSYWRTLLKESTLSNGMRAALSDVADSFSQSLVDEITATNEPKLICRYSVLACNPCISFAREKLNEHFSDFMDSGQIIMFVRDQNKKAELSFEFTINTGKTRFDMPVDNLLVPYYFVYNNGTVENVFIPDSAVPEFTDIYLNAIKKRYFNIIVD